jgi:hypothetical protein
MRACGVVSEDLPRCGLSKESKKERRLDSALGESRQDSASQPKSRREDWRSTYSPSLKLYSKSRTLAGRSPQELELVTVPVSVLARLTTTRGSLPDHPIRPSIKTAEGDEKLLGLLTVGVLVIRASDFEVWYRSERAKGKWPSQRSRLKISGGRPTKQTEPVRNAVIGLVRDGKWSGKISIAKLHRLLIASSDDKVPSPDTLARLVDQLHAETGEAEFFRVKRAQRK